MKLLSNPNTSQFLSVGFEELRQLYKRKLHQRTAKLWYRFVEKLSSEVCAQNRAGTGSDDRHQRPREEERRGEDQHHPGSGLPSVGHRQAAQHQRTEHRPDGNSRLIMLQ